MIESHDQQASGTRRLRTIAITGGVGLAAAGLAAYLRRRRAPWRDAPIDLRDGTTSTPHDDGPPADPAHAPGHTHLAPPPGTSRPVTGEHADRGYEQGHRDRGGRSTAFHTERDH